MQIELSLLIIFLIIIGIITIVTLTTIFLSINTIFNVFSLIIVFIMSSFMLILQNFEFLAIILTALYVGAVSVFFLFVLMTINLRFEDTYEYIDDISKDKNLSFFFLCFFSIIMHSWFFFEFKFQNFSYILNDFYALKKFKIITYEYLNALNNYFKNSYLEENTTIDEMLNADNFDINRIMYFEKINNFTMQNTDIILLGESMFLKAPVSFLLVTFTLLLTLIGAVGLAVRGK